MVEKRSISDGPDLLDIFCLWEYVRDPSGKASVASPKGTPAQDALEKKPICAVVALTDQHVDRLSMFHYKSVQVNFNLKTGRCIKHNFTNEPTCYLDVELTIMGKNNSDYLHIRMLNPYEKMLIFLLKKIREKSSQVYAVSKNQKYLFFWEGKNERRINMAGHQVRLLPI